MTSGAFPSHPRPLERFQQARERVEALCALDAQPDVHSDYGTLFLSHGRKTERVVVFLHGFTSSPPQFRSLAERFFARGDNVLVPRLPRHGLHNRMTSELASLRATHLTAWTDEIVDIAGGLGERITLAGLSLGGVLAAWAAIHRADLHQAGLIAPNFGLLRLGMLPSLLLGHLCRALPNCFLWWDPRVREAIGPAHAYPRFSTRALGQMLLLGQAIYDASRSGPPAARAVLLVTNAGDFTVSNAVAEQIVRNWQRHGAAQVRVYRFDNLPALHDFIDPGQPNARPDLVYPVLLDLLDG